MELVIVWLLISLQGGGYGYNSNVPATRIAAFADLTECERVRAVLINSDERGRQPLQCIQAKVVKGF